jgi:putative PIN family toxin of toxin-antitoxin system
MTRRAVVLDTNILLDLWVFDDPPSQRLRTALETGQLDWLVTADMRSELARVLAYPQIAPRLAYHQRSAADVLDSFDRHARVVPTAPKAPVTCRDADDQKFIDLAVSHRATLLSKDKAVTSMKKRLQALGISSDAATLFVA